ncbi:hypothetical protein [Sphingosinithalassobacter portus]|uniref:hypothetical protein n=1 Tax=Stakelama portus TaxID=2676234 RepID=UPI0011AB4E3B|nr:hypothetical protein [Sphingosinithalassobacter portus]
MLLALAVLLSICCHPAAIAQDASATAPADEEVYEEIVVQTRAGLAALVFDRGPDGRLYNCRLFKTSGVDTVDAEACDNFRDCTIDDDGNTHCREETVPVVAPILLDTRPNSASIADRLAKPDINLLEPEPVSDDVGPGQRRANTDDPNRLGKLPPPPTDPTRSGSVITFGTPQPDDQR